MRVPALAAGQVPAGEQACFGALQATPSVITQSHQNSQMHVDSAGKVWSHGVLGVWGLVLQTREPFPKGTDQCLFTGAPGFAEGAWAWHAWGCPSPCERWIPRVEPQSANRDLACSACPTKDWTPRMPRQSGGGAGGRAWLRARRVDCAVHAAATAQPLLQTD